MRASQVTNARKHFDTSLAQRGRVTSDYLSTNMNTFVQSFSTIGPASELRRARELATEDEDFSDALWGSVAGHGSLAKGLPSFLIPNVPSVRLAPSK
jgi:hypothetical protein